MIPQGKKSLEQGIQAPKLKRCGSCSELFGCSASEAHCWCEELSLGKSELSELRGRFSDCLCPKCLAAASINPGLEAGSP